MKSTKPLTRSWQVMGEKFDIEFPRYHVSEYLGAGAYGVVCAASDTQENCTVAIKKCKKIFHSRTLAKRTLRELRLLRLINHDNIVKIKTVLAPEDDFSFSELYIVFEIMETDLAQIIRSAQALKDQHVQYFVYQIFLGLNALHSVDIIHRDLKPRNILINSNCHIKLADFGLARIYNEKNSSKIVAMTEYVTTRWYRAPEILVGWANYSAAVDVWAVGCIVAELIGRVPLFPGSDSVKQLDLICSCLGKPSDYFIDSARKSSYRQYLRDLPSDTKTADLRTMYPAANPHAISLLQRLLAMNPGDRCSIEDALQSTYLRPLYTQADQNAVLRTTGDLAAEFAFEDKRMTIDELRDEILYEVRCHNGLSPADPPVIDTAAATAGALDRGILSKRAVELTGNGYGGQDLAFSDCHNLFDEPQRNVATSTIPRTLDSLHDSGHVAAPPVTTIPPPSVHRVRPVATSEPQAFVDSHRTAPTGAVGAPGQRRRAYCDAPFRQAPASGRTTSSASAQAKSTPAPAYSSCLYPENDSDDTDVCFSKSFWGFGMKKRQPDSHSGRSARSALVTGEVHKPSTPRDEVDSNRHEHRPSDSMGVKSEARKETQEVVDVVAAFESKLSRPSASCSYVESADSSLQEAKATSGAMKGGKTGQSSEILPTMTVGGRVLYRPREASEKGPSDELGTSGFDGRKLRTQSDRPVFIEDDSTWQVVSGDFGSVDSEQQSHSVALLRKEAQLQHSSVHSCQIL